MILPFIESNNLYGMYSNNLHRQPRHQPSSVLQQLSNYRNETFYCPSRGFRTRTNDGFTEGMIPDYLGVATAWNRRPSDPLAEGMIVGPETSVGLPGSGNNSFRARIGFESVTDGLSNTLMIHEEHIPPEDIGGEWDEPACLVAAYENADDYGRPQFGVASNIHFTGSNYRWMFGSWHPTLFVGAMGDGSVRVINNNVTGATLRAICDREDGNTVELP